MKNQYSTTSWKLNYDKPLNTMQKICWFYFNFINNLNPNFNVDKQIKK